MRAREKPVSELFGRDPIFSSPLNDDDYKRDGKENNADDRETVAYLKVSWR